MNARAGVRFASFLALAGLVAGPAISRAADVRPVIVAGYDTGGDKIVNVTFVDGTSDSIRANEGLYVGAGVSVLNDERNLEFLGTVNYKYQAIHAQNGDITWTRIPVDALLFYRWPHFRVGGGLTFQLSPKLSGSGAAGNINPNIDDAVGLLLQADYLVGKFAVGLRGTFVDFKSNGSTANGSGVGVTFGFRF